jgi:hypothetical protein
MHGPWIEDPVLFVREVRAEIGDRPTKQYSLDRKNNAGNYEPGNLKWSDRFEQANNMRRNFVIEHDGKRRTLAQWQSATGIKLHTIRARYLSGRPLSEVFSKKDLRVR